MLATRHGSDSWTRGVLALLAALAVAWASLAGPARATPPDEVSASMQDCCPHAAGTDGPARSGRMKMDHPCDSERGCPSPDCTMAASSLAAGTLDGYPLAGPGPGLETRSRTTSSQPHSFALPIPKQPPKI